MEDNESSNYWDQFKSASLPEKFERAVAMLLSIAVAIVVVLSVVRVFILLGQSISSEADVLGYGLFQTVFGMIMVVLIALEFNHIIIQIIHGIHAVAQLRMVVAIAILAIVRKLVILDITKTEPEMIFALGLVLFALGGVYWLIRNRQPDQPIQ